METFFVLNEEQIFPFLFFYDLSAINLDLFSINSFLYASISSTSTYSYRKYYLYHPFKVRQKISPLPQSP